MIQVNRNYGLPERTQDDPAIKIVGVGGAGANALDRIILDGMERVELIALNTDVQSLASSVATQKVQLGRNVTRGLGTGGDPELGFAAAQESGDEIREALAGARMIFLCGGLGGGTGSGALPRIAEMMREGGALVIAFVTLPFAFEGKRRGRQALDALDQLERAADAVVCFENDRMGDMVLPKAGIHQAFAAADATISQSVRAIVHLIQRPGLIQIGFDHLLAALRGRNSRCLFGYGESDSDNRAHEALALALKNPLMSKGKTLANAERVLVQICGGPGMTLTEVEMVMQELGRQVEDDTQILFGTAVDNRMGDRLSVTLISSIAGPSKEQAFTTSPPIQVAPPPPQPPAEAEPKPELPNPIVVPVPSITVDAVLPDETLHQKVVAKPAPVRREKKLTPPAAPVAPEEAALIPEPVAEKSPAPRKPKFVQARQEVMQFEPVTRGRFEKSEPTIVEGQDLDVPTYLRKNVRVK